MAANMEAFRPRRIPTGPGLSVAGAKADNLAYVIYTSGSTGTPKGVSISHRAISRLVCNTNYVQLESVDRVALVSNPSFDAATFEVWGALLHGAQLVGVPKEVALTPRLFAGQINEQRISTLFLTTAIFNQIASEIPQAFHTVKNLLFGGEAVDPKLVKAVLKHGSPKRFLHVYGPTEGTTFTCWHLITEVPEGEATVPIGRPVSNTQIYLLDPDRCPVPIGVSGELYIGGDGLARGYLHQPALTIEKFVSNPFSNEPGAKLYRTGDLGRYRSLGVNVPVGTLFKSPTIAQLAGALREQVKPEFHSLIAIQPEGSKAPFFCVHGYNSYVHLARHLRHDRPLYGLAQHLEGRKIRHTRIEDIAAHYIEELRCIQTEGPYFLGGHSIGGLIAFEMAQQLHQQGQEVAFLALFDPTPPRSHKSSYRPGYSDLARAHYYNLMRVGFKGKLGYAARTISAPVQSTLKRIVCSAYHSVGISLPPKLQTFYVDEIVYKSLYAKMSQDYSPSAYPGSVDLFRAEESAHVAGVWDALAVKGTKLHLNPGNHLSMITEPGISTLAGKLQACLDKVQS